MSHNYTREYGWLAAWGLPQSSPTTAMSWMSTDNTGSGHGMDMSGDATGQPSAGGKGRAGAVMPGMATAEDLGRLGELSGRDADVLYLQLMIPHQRGGVAMARIAAERATQPQVRRLAQSIVNSQTAELAMLQQLLDARAASLTGP